MTNSEINQKLQQLYAENTTALLSCWGKHYSVPEADYPCRINEFGIIDTERFDKEKRILVIGKETNGWSNEDYKNNDMFIPWMTKITRKESNCLAGQEGKIRKNPQTWYNIGRWIMALCGSEIEKIQKAKDEAFHALGTAAFTNINKVRGGSVSGKSYRELSKEPQVVDVLIKEIEIIKPKHIILCDKTFVGILLSAYADKKYADCTVLKDCISNNTFYVMPHPASRKSTVKLLEELFKSQTIAMQSNYLAKK